MPHPDPNTNHDLADMENETWLPLPNYEEIYEISDLGRVKSLARTIHRPGDKALRSLPEKILKPSPGTTGYLSFAAHRNGIGKRTNVHRPVLATFVGPLPKGMVTRHLNGNRIDNRLVNLSYGTQAENCEDMRTHGTLWSLSVTHCPYGHRLVEPNLTPSSLKQNYRACKACSRASGQMQLRNLGPEHKQAISDEYYAQILAGTDGPATHCNRGHRLGPPNNRTNGACRACCRARGYIHGRPELKNPIELQRIADEYYARILAGTDGPAEGHCKRGHLIEGPNIQRPSPSRPKKQGCKSCGYARGYVHRHPELRSPAGLQKVADNYYAKLNMA